MNTSITLEKFQCILEDHKNADKWRIGGNQHLFQGSEAARLLKPHAVGKNRLRCPDKKSPLRRRKYKMVQKTRTEFGGEIISTQADSRNV